MNGKAGWRIGLGPVFVYEWLTSSRRWQGYAIRAGFLLLLLISLAVIWNSTRPLFARSPIRMMATLGEWFYIGVIGMEVTLVLLAAPAATAGAICLDRARGTLTHMLMTDLSSAEIVLGKLAARLIPVLGLLACTLPLMEILALVGGLDPNALFGAFVVTTGIAILGSSLALLFSLWVGKTHEALLGTYAVWVVWLLWRPISGLVRVWFPGAYLPPPRSADPFWLAFAPYWSPRLVAWEDYASFLGVTTGLSAVLVGIAMLRVRAIVTRDLVNRRAARSLLGRFRERLALGRYLPAGSLDWNPVFWRECHRGKPSRWARAVSILYFAIAATFSLTTISLQSTSSAPWINGMQVSVGLLVLSVTAAASLAEERARGSLDLLMTTMLSTREIVLGKWLGTYRAVPLLAVLPAAVAFGFAYDKPDHWHDVGRIIAYVLFAGAAITSLGLAMATWFTRVGSAVAATVSVYVAITVGWVFLVLMLYGPGRNGEGMLMASPFIWTLLATITIVEPDLRLDSLLAWSIIWPVALALCSLVLLLATLTSFDRKLGRAEGPSLRLIHGDFTRGERAFGATFIAMALLGTAVAMFAAPQSGLAVLINGAQVSVGLFVAALAAALSASRQLGGGLAPAARFGQSSPRIVLAKWLGACRTVGLVALLVTLAVLARWDFMNDPLQRIWLVPIYVLFIGASFCSLGVALGMWFSRLTALLLTAAIYALILTVGPISGGMLFEYGQAEIAWTSSPMVAASALTIAVTGGPATGFDVFAALPVVIGAHTCATAILLTAAIVTLERRFTRERTAAAQPSPATAN